MNERIIGVLGFLVILTVNVTLLVATALALPIMFLMVLLD